MRERCLDHPGHGGRGDAPGDEGIKRAFLGGVEGRAHEAANIHDLSRQIERRIADGIGGVEIQPIYPALKGSPLENRTCEINWLSEQWVDLIAHTVKVAREKNIQVDLTFGSGWPFGGPYIEKKMASTRITGYSMQLGDQKEDIEIPLEDLIEDPSSLVAVFAIKTGEREQLTDEVIDLKGSIVNQEIRWNKPADDWSLFWYYIEPVGQKVKRSGPGAEGLVLDHLNKAALKIHADKILTSLIPKLGENLGESFGAFFCDSWEVYGENFTYGFLEEFEKIKGYDLAPHLYKVIPTQSGKRSQIGAPGVLYDYKHLHSHYILKEFFSAFADTCHSVGVKCRVQPYSAPTDLLRAYGLLDVLEIEGFGRHGIGTMYYGSVDPRLASSGAHMYGKEIISCESFTWLGEHFSVSLDHIKKEADQIILHGVNRIIYHGYPFSPQEAGNPGWVFYASLMANHNNTWWPYAELLNKYIARNSMIAQNGTYIADFAVYIPYHDEWSDKEGTLKKLRQTLKGHGHLNDFDYINDERINNATITSEGLLEISGRRYAGMIFCDVEYLPLPIAEKIADFVDKKLPVYLIGQTPKKAPGLIAQSNGESQKVHSLFKDLQKMGGVVSLANIDDFNTYLIEKGYTLDCVLSKSDNSPAEAYYIHYHYPDLDFYFIVNEGESQIFTIKFRSRGKVEVWDTLEARIESIPEGDIMFHDSGTEVRLLFPKHDAKWIVFKKSEGAYGDSIPRGFIPKEAHLFKLIPEGEPNRDQIRETFVIDTLWDIEFSIEENTFPKIEQSKFKVNQTKLFDWTEKVETRYFSGTADYTSIINIPTEWVEESTEIVLDLGEVYHIAEVWINGNHIKTLWTGQYMVNVREVLKSGENIVRIRVTNLLLNRIIGYEKQGLKWSPEYYFVNIDYDPFKAKEMGPLPSGLIGPIQLNLHKQ